MTLYHQTVSHLIKYLTNLSALLEKGAKYADEQGTKHKKILNFRLAPDMRGWALVITYCLWSCLMTCSRLPYQVQSRSNTAKFIPVRLGVMDDIYLEDDEATFDQLHSRITRTIEILRSVDERALDGKENEPLIMKTRMGDFKFESGQQYVSDYALPNFHFHLGTAYCILRHLGVPIGALDYLGKDTFVKVDSGSID